MKTREGIADLVDGCGSRVSSDSQKAEILNNFFCSVFTKENMENVPECKKKQCHTSLSSVEFTKESVLKKLQNLNPGKSPGFHPQVLKELAEELAEPVPLIFSKSLAEGKLPESRKDANVTPFFKKGDKSKPGNYHPVSLTSVLGKVMESIIKDRVVEHMESNSFSSECQHGFIAKRSCTANPLAVLDKWTESLDRCTPVDAVSLDFSKAFDSVPHHCLLFKLKSYGIGQSGLAWIKDCLLGRRQRVGVNGTYSDWVPVTSGVPQGSVLGPVLFVVSINDLPDIVNSLCQMYADDVKVVAEVEKESVAKLQQDLDMLVEWADLWQLRFNADKCKVLHLGQNNPKLSNRPTA